MATAISGDLFRQCADFALHAGMLLQLRVLGSPSVLIRSAYERGLDLCYLITKGDKIANAERCRARTLLEVADVFADQPSGREASEILALMPAEVVAQERRYQRERRGWAGLTTRQMADEIAVEGHGPLYSVLSWQAHGRIVGYEIVEHRHGEDQFELSFAERSTPRDRQSLANFGRRLLHVVYGVIALDWLGRVPPLATSNPHESQWT